MATSETKLSMKLLIDTKAKKVLFAEVDKDCIDFLFHILSLPLGRVTKLLKDRGMNGCLNNLYQSVEDLNDSYLESKNIILQPECPHLSKPYDKNDELCYSAACTCGPAANRGFVKELQVKYMVMDDLVVKPLSAVSSITALKDNFNVKDVGALHEEVVQFGTQEVIGIEVAEIIVGVENNLTSLFMTGVKVEK
ncbi:putative myb-related protein-like [Capsicum annuum]|uniref:uncharacterized protein LOC107864016 n=1 Tax=Capsicum annuum TaxID=4072 RepID=UPI0007BFDEFB|nr:uncharacterized protein LOC107864016 [Capsicum annuum]KAF3640429.1 putative myb-related protein-like [Capsicum annuum]KAF3653319.1 putative myb-related protein-like [Capsicum annuum]